MTSDINSSANTSDNCRVWLLAVLSVFLMGLIPLVPGVTVNNERSAWAGG